MKRLALTVVLAACGSKETPPSRAADAAPRPIDAEPARKTMLVRLATCAIVPPRAIGSEQQIRALRIDTGFGEATQPIHLAAGGYLCVLSARTTSDADSIPPPFTDPDFALDIRERKVFPPGDPGAFDTKAIVVRDAGYERDLKKLAEQIGGLEGNRRKAACKDVATREPPDAAAVRPRAAELAQHYLETGEATPSTDEIERSVDDLRRLCGF